MSVEYDPCKENKLFHMVKLSVDKIFTIDGIRKISSEFRNIKNVQTVL